MWTIERARKELPPLRVVLPGLDGPVTVMVALLAGETCASMVLVGKSNILTGHALWCDVVNALNTNTPLVL